MKKLDVEIQAGVKVIPVVVDKTDNYCSHCIFDCSESCASASCMGVERPDGNEVYFIKADDDIEVTLESTTDWQENNIKELFEQVEMYRRICDSIGEILGFEAYVSDDGSIQDRPLIMKLEELVSAKVHENVLLKTKIRQMEALSSINLL